MDVWESGLIQLTVNQPPSGFVGSNPTASTSFRVVNPIAEWSSLAARWPHKPKVGGSNPPSATKCLFCLRKQTRPIVRKQRAARNAIVERGLR